MHQGGGFVTEQARVGVNDIQGPPPFFSRGPSLVLSSLCLLPEERCLSMPEIGEKERNYHLFEIIQTKVL